MSRSLKVADIGELGLLKKLQPFCPREIVGDDAAILDIPDGKSLVISTDVLVDGVHFNDQTTSAEDVGWRAAAANLSDIAAMGASPLGITVGLSLPGTVAVSWVEELYQGLANCLHPHQTPILGGDICRSPVISLNITAIGAVSPAHAIHRSQAQPGQVIVVTGYHGSSRAGLELLLNPHLGESLSTKTQKELIVSHQRPQARLDVLKHLWPIVQNTTVAGMDSSDGLADGLIQICQSSGVGAVIDSQLIPRSPALMALVPPDQALEWALYGGEDFELVLCLSLDAANLLVQQLGEGAAIIGKVTPGHRVELIDPQRNLPNRILTQSRSFQHY